MAYDYFSGTKCDDVWYKWDMACAMYYSDECEEMEILMNQVEVDEDD